MDRADAMKFYGEAMMGCDPMSSDCGRYTKIYTELLMGLTTCTDEE